MYPLILQEKMVGHLLILVATQLRWN